MSTDAIVMLKDDHEEILRTFRDFENAGPAAHKTNGRLVDRMIELLTVHTYVENEVMYPRVREQEWFPQVRAALGRKTLQRLGHRWRMPARRPHADRPNRAR